MAQHTPRIWLKRGRDSSARRRHPWVFSGAVERQDSLEDGAVVEVFSSDGNYLGTGFYSDDNIVVKFLSFTRSEISPEFWKQALLRAKSLRAQLGLVGNSETTAYRLVHGEGDGLPGLVIDIYNRTAVVQCQTRGMLLHQEEIADAIRNVCGDDISGIYSRGSLALSGKAKEDAADADGAYLWGTATDSVIREHGHRFDIDWTKGQKTGFFLDQRENRHLLSQYVRGKTVLNSFCYTGGFSVYAFAGGAASVTSIDASKPAMETLTKNLELNGIAPEKHRSITGDCFDYLTNTDDTFDVAVVDPPAFAKHQAALASALKGYLSINTNAIKRLRPGGLLFTFSCSQHVDRETFRRTIRNAAGSSGRAAQILFEMHQGPCHPVSAYHPEGEYLKGLVLRIGE